MKLFASGFIYITILIHVFNQLGTTVGNCILAGNQADGSPSQEYLKRLEPLLGKIFKHSYADKTEGGHEYEYTLAICSQLEGRKDFAGVVQADPSGQTKVIGRFNTTSVKGGTDWIMLTYQGGDNYHSHCFPAGKPNAKRQAHIMIVCNPDKLEGQFTVLYEENKSNTEPECYYMMELESSVACQASAQTGLGAGSIFAIVFFTLAFVYLVVGMAYKRFVFGSKGVDQLPNIGFWKSCGSLQADGCDYLCRCQESGFDSSRPYRGIADDQLDEEEGDDEHLLPM